MDDPQQLPNQPSSSSSSPSSSSPPLLPRISIQYCTQCKWMLRAAYFAQELLSTFGLALGEVALQPATGGVFRVSITTVAAALGQGEEEEDVTIPTTATATATATTTKMLWDRKTEGGFPEVKELKRRVRDVVQPERDLGHVDRGKNDRKKEREEAPPEKEENVNETETKDEDSDKEKGSKERLVDDGDGSNKDRLLPLDDERDVGGKPTDADADAMNSTPTSTPTPTLTSDAKANRTTNIDEGRRAECEDC